MKSLKILAIIVAVIWIIVGITAVTYEPKPKLKPFGQNGPIEEIYIDFSDARK